MFHIHRWDKWSVPKPGREENWRGDVREISVQTRDCRGCNKRQLRSVDES